MKIYWSMNSIPELDGLDRREKRRRYRALYRHGLKGTPWWHWIAIGVVAATMMVPLNLLGVSHPAVSGAIGGGVAGLASNLFIVCPAVERGRVWYRAHYGSD